MVVRTIAQLLLVACCSAELHAQETSSLAVGDRVRLRTAALGEVTGNLTSLTAAALVLEVASDASQVTVDVTEVTRIERSTGRVTRGDSAWHAARWGALIGAVPGAISLGLQHEQVGEDGSSAGAAAALGAFSGGLFGALIGAAIGAGRAGERWEEVPRSSLGVAPTVGRDGAVGVVVSWAF